MVPTIRFTPKWVSIKISNPVCSCNEFIVRTSVREQFVRFEIT
jgi:hypothetical protein